MPQPLAISDLSDRAAILYFYVADWHDDKTGTCGSYQLVESCAECAGLGELFRSQYGPASEWEGTWIDTGELIHWAHSLG